MDNFENRENFKVSRRAQMLAMREGIDCYALTGTGPEGRVIENDILRAIEERDRLAREAAAKAAEEAAAKEAAEAAEKETLEEAADPAEEAAVEEVTETVAQEVAAEEAVTEEIAEPAAEEVAAEELAEPAAEEAAAEEIAEPAAEEPAAEEASEEETEMAAEAAVEEIPEPAAEEAAQTAIVAAPVVAVCETAHEEQAQSASEPKAKTDRTAEAYRHTDVILSHAEGAPDGTPVTIGMSFDATAILTLREKIKTYGETLGLPGVTVGDMILFAVSKTVKKHKALNAHLLGDTIRYFDGVHLSFDVDTECGPETLTVFDADRLSLASLSKITGTLIRGVRAGNGSPEKNRRTGSFTVTNVGTLGIESFVPVLRAPQTGILGVCAKTDRVRCENGKIETYPAIALSLTFDPRAMSTANAAKFLRELCTVLENFGLLLIR